MHLFDERGHQNRSPCKPRAQGYGGVRALAAPWGPSQVGQSHVQPPSYAGCWPRADLGKRILHPVKGSNSRHSRMHYLSALR